ncbi:ectoine/hydroxyectoine ABC transporter permease subunit EhuC [Komagataeibacter xylinus]|uniref:Ectoine/hydroxyectoine ABC transporter permease subunit EhuC n=2 Tax=Komagataeibacter swingsii TaxID=215220 RepID=A0A850P6K4_9PROT|nr:ectoine/hydroxyectoine ABC transporter permease subunit EhuC [Komagataeibacter xylinus]AZV37545.1 ectoine/hydroxyectoine ABC transporter permease subunit EhuC [Komagataeibacter xylinus]NVN38359.1 ectoine/hydroxyectoine ABC transporter permease subunit EhuC [Komagataeibacter swingsii]
MMEATMQDIAVSMGYGLLTTVWLTICGCMLALSCAFSFGLGQISRWRLLRIFSASYVEIFRGTSVFVQIFWLYYALPALGILLSPMLSGILALGLNVGAYGAEVVRSAIIAVDRTQTEVATSLKLTRWQTLRYVILPQAIPRMIPVFSNNSVELLKATAIVSMISLSDITFQAQQYRIRTSQTIMPFIITLALYFMIYILILYGFSHLERKFAVVKKGK